MSDAGPARFVDVAVDLGAARLSTLTYHVPPDMALDLGQLVAVPLASRRVAGLVVRMTSEPPDFDTRPVAALLRPKPVVAPFRIELARWIAERYHAPFWDALGLMLPPGLTRELVAVEQPTPARRRAPAASSDRADAGAGSEPLAEVRPEPRRLTAGQWLAFEQIAAPIRRCQPRVFVLHGVTGSGKTHVYLEAAAEAIAAGRQAVVLVAEIALTPAALERFEARFPGRVAALHSRLRPREQRRAWERIAAGEAQLVVGARSALFAPVPRPGLIVLDEAHEWAYKQEQSPRYDARAVALRLGELTGAPVVFSSATPDVETYHRARSGQYTLLELTERYGPTPLAPLPAAGRGDRPGAVTPHLPPRPLPPTAGAAQGPRHEESGSSREAEWKGSGDRVRPLPTVTVVDLRAELRAGNRGLFSRALDAAIGAALARQEQVILYLNRRGGATCVSCRDCGHVLRCRRCDLPLVYHSAGEALVCHVCNRQRPSPERCPGCNSLRIRYLGLGTQRVEQEAQQRFPEARVLRWDRDVASNVEMNAWLWRTFAEGQADILVGTQMIAKAFDFPRVTVVGVVLADSGLFLPDFRAAERSFQLLSQVAGRAGRGEQPGRAFIQTYTPDHYAVQAAAAHDYAGFFGREIAFRRAHGYPPYRRLARLVHTASSEARGWAETQALAETLRREIAARGLADLDVLGAAPAFHRRIRGAYRWQIVLAGDHFERLLDVVPARAGWTVDVDPLSVL